MSKAPVPTPTQVPSPPAAPAPASPTPQVVPARAKGFADQIAAKYPDVKVEWMKERRLKVSTTPLRIR